MSDERALPAGAALYRRLPDFSGGTTPAALLRAHRLKAGVYGVLRVRAGVVRFFLAGGEEPLAVLRGGEAIVILPEEEHYIRPSEDADFQISFFR